MAATPVVRPLPTAPFPGATGEVIGRSDKLVVYLPRTGDTLPGIAERLLGTASRAWEIADANGQRWQPLVGQPLVVPMAPLNPKGVSLDAVQTVPILCYHRFGNGPSKMVVSPAQFEAQLEFLARNQYQVVRLDDLAAFLAGRQALPQKSVVITIDDGYESVHRHAFPLLKKYRMPATLFVYSDFIGARDALDWAQIKEMADSGLVDIQAHSKTHRNLIERAAAETDAAYRQALDAELRVPRQQIERRIGSPVRHFAYPFGDANDQVLETMQRLNYEIGVTVHPGGNPFFGHPLMLRRTMIFGDHDLEDFKARLVTRRPLVRP